MKFLLSSLKNYIPTRLSAEKIAETLTLIGLEVDSIRPVEPKQDLQEVKDVIFEVSLTPNLSHCTSLLGIAKELSAVTKEPVHIPQVLVKETEKPIEEFVSISVEARDLCPRYACRVMTGVKVGPSPLWLRECLEQSGIRSINNVVDATNFVLLEWGQPLHAFDLDTLKERRLVIRKARSGEKIVTLDGKEHFPTEETLLICDAVAPVAIAGIMGSQHTEVTNQTETVLLEAAYFEPRHIRRSSKRMGIHTESAKRFERGTDPNAVLQALDRAVTLIQKITQGSVAKGTIDIKTMEFPLHQVSCRLQRINQLLGIHLAMSEVETIFKQLHFQIKSSKNDVLVLLIPTYRHDIQQEIDLIEEVARLYGYDAIHQNSSVPVYQTSMIPHNPLYLFEQKVRSILLNEGLQELLTCNLISPVQADLLGKDYIPSRSLIKLLNPSSADQSVLRPSLFPNLLQVVKYNHDHEVHSLGGFEIGKIHFKAKEHYLEPTVASIVLSGKRSHSHWGEKPQDFDFFDLKGIVENWMEELKVSHVEWIPSNFESFHPGRQARLVVDQHEIGIVGEVHPKTLQKIGIAQPIFFAELNLEDLIQLSNKTIKMKPLPQFPSSTRDWTITLDVSCPVQQVFDFIEQQHSSILENIFLLDIYYHEKLEKEWKNVTFRFIYRDLHQTVAFKTVEEEHARITKNVFQKLLDEKKVQI